MIERFELSQGEKLNPVWLRLREHFENERTRLRARNDDESLTEKETAAIRGHIKCLTALLSLGNDRPMTGDDW